MPRSLQISNAPWANDCNRFVRLRKIIQNNLYRFCWRALPDLFRNDYFACINASFAIYMIFSTDFPIRFSAFSPLQLTIV